MQRLPAKVMRLLVHWGAEVDARELKVCLDHSDDLTHEQIIDILIADLRARGERFEIPSDPIGDPAFVQPLTRVYDPGRPAMFPPEPIEPAAACRGCRRGETLRLEQRTF